MKEAQLTVSRSAKRAGEGEDEPPVSPVCYTLNSCLWMRNTLNELPRDILNLFWSTRIETYIQLVDFILICIYHTTFLQAKAPLVPIPLPFCEAYLISNIFIMYQVASRCLTRMSEQHSRVGGSIVTVVKSSELSFTGNLDSLVLPFSQVP